MIQTVETSQTLDVATYNPKSDVLFTTCSSSLIWHTNKQLVFFEQQANINQHILYVFSVE